MIFASMKLKPESGTNRIKSADDAFSSALAAFSLCLNNLAVPRMSVLSAIIVAVWVALNAAILNLMVIRHAHHLKHRSYWWVIGAQQPVRSAHDLVLAHNRHR